MVWWSSEDFWVLFSANFHTELGMSQHRGPFLNGEVKGFKRLTVMKQKRKEGLVIFSDSESEMVGSRGCGKEC